MPGGPGGRDGHVWGRPCLGLLGPESGRGPVDVRGSAGVCSVAQGPAELSRRCRQVCAPAREPRLQLPGAGGLRALPAGACPWPAPCPSPVCPRCAPHMPLSVCCCFAHCTPPTAPAHHTHVPPLLHTPPPLSQARPYVYTHVWEPGSLPLGAASAVWEPDSLTSGAASAVWEPGSLTLGGRLPGLAPCSPLGAV